MKTHELFADLDANAEEIIDNKLDEIEERLSKLEKKNRWRDILALVEEYKEWGCAKNGDDCDMMWLEDLTKYRHMMD